MSGNHQKAIGWSALFIDGDENDYMITVQADSLPEAASKLRQLGHPITSIKHIRRTVTVTIENAKSLEEFESVNFSVQPEIEVGDG